jgi:hypothetical protein
VPTTTLAAVQSPRVAAKPADFAISAAHAAKPILSSMRVARPVKHSVASATKDDSAGRPVMASARIANRPELTRGPQVIPAKASFGNKKLAQPAVLIFWQETYDDGYGNVIQRSYWRVVVLPAVPKEQGQPKRI